MSFVDSVVKALDVPQDIERILHSAQSRDDLAQHLTDLVKAVANHESRLSVLEQPGASPALVKLAVQISDLQSALAIAQAKQKANPTGENAAQVVLIQQEIAAAKATAPQAQATPGDVSAVSAVLKELLAPAPVSPAQQLVNQGGNQ